MAFWCISFSLGYIGVWHTCQPNTFILNSDCEIVAFQIGVGCSISQQQPSGKSLWISVLPSIVMSSPPRCRSDQQILIRLSKPDCLFCRNSLSTTDLKGTEFMSLVAHPEGRPRWSMNRSVLLRSECCSLGVKRPVASGVKPIRQGIMPDSGREMKPRDKGRTGHLSLTESIQHIQFFKWT
jgi:hypothetical protein